MVADNDCAITTALPPISTPVVQRKLPAKLSLVSLSHALVVVNAMLGAHQ
eukprot:SAG31_NODE_253_length_19063_cov_31.913362_3_plen_50_part_00